VEAFLKRREWGREEEKAFSILFREKRGGGGGVETECRAHDDGRVKRGEKESFSRPYV